MYSQVATQTPAFFEQINQLIVSNNPDPVILTRFKNEAQIKCPSQIIMGGFVPIFEVIGDE